MDVIYRAVISFSMTLSDLDVLALQVIRFAQLQCESLLFQSPRLSSVCLSRVSSRKLSEIGAKFRRLCRKSGSPSKNMTSAFALEVAKYPKVAPNFQIAQNSVRAYCLAP